MTDKKDKKGQKASPEHPKTAGSGQDWFSAPDPEEAPAAAEPASPKAAPAGAGRGPSGPGPSRSQGPYPARTQIPRPAAPSEGQRGEPPRRREEARTETLPAAPAAAAGLLPPVSAEQLLAEAFGDERLGADPRLPERVPPQTGYERPSMGRTEGLRRTAPPDPIPRTLTIPPEVLPARPGVVTREAEKAIGGARGKLGEMLVDAGILNAQQLEQALSMAKRSGERLGLILTRAGFIRPEQITEAIAKQFGVEYLAPGHVNRELVDRAALANLGLPLLRTHHLLPVVWQGVPYLLIADPLDTQGTDAVEARIGKRPYLLTTQVAIDMVLQILAFETLDAEHIIESARESIAQGQVAALLEYILGRAVLEKVSDVHIEPTGVTTVVRYRMEGAMRTALSLPRERHENLANVLFGRAGVDLSDFNRLHDGRFAFSFAGRHLDVRFASSPTVEGPMIVLRILDDSRSLATLEELGYTRHSLAVIQHLLRHPFGLILVVGPTGSGKTTSLYSCLTRLNDGARKILTVEDPVEIRLPTIQQVQVNEKAGVNFAKTVRAFLRQDPDVIIVGEIRDEETAREAFRAATTGHLVLSTLHANSAVESIGRLLDLGLEPYQVSQTLLGTLSQRLVRKLCGACRVKTTFPVSRLLPNAYDTLQSLVEDPPLDLALAEPGKGCGKCSDGHVGRTVVAEVLVLDEVAREQIHQRAANSAIIGSAKKQGFQTMMDHALGLVLQGVTSLLEAEAVVGPMTMPDAA